MAKNGFARPASGDAVLYLVTESATDDKPKMLTLDGSTHAALTNHLRMSLTMSMRLADQLGLPVPAALVAEALGWVETKPFPHIE